jgi:hypothetical protein
MSITVVTARDEFGSPTTREVYEDGVKYTQDNGNLDILSAKPSLLATYGSGNWLSVHVGDSVNVVVTKPEEGDSDSDSDFSFDFGGDDSSDDSSDDSGDDSSDSDETGSSDDDEATDDDSTGDTDSTETEE